MKHKEEEKLLWLASAFLVKLEIDWVSKRKLLCDCEHNMITSIKWVLIHAYCINIHYNPS